MLELGRKESHLLSGLGVQVLVVALLVFVYTQAARQLSSQRRMTNEMREQLALAKAEVAREGPPNLAEWKAKVAGFKQGLVTRQMLSERARNMERMAKEEYGFRDLKIKVGENPEKTIAVPMTGEERSFEVHLYSLELTGSSTSRRGADFLSNLNRSNLKLLCPLEVVEMKALPPDQPMPVEFRLKWLVAVSSEAAAEPPPGETVPKKQLLEWGPREEPFVSPFLRSSALRVPPKPNKKLRLTGILWDSEAPTCVIGGTLLKVGDSVEGYEVVLITPKAVLLQGAQEELFLSLP
ncbi:MAG: hypothetical protein HYZ90_07470 [Candidatus Omnitrophica bacterium]|nr:hypothetical protein [Candidatus Omnitrophota bacterium]